MHKEILLIRKIFTARQFFKTANRVSGNPNTKKEKLVDAYDNLLLNLMPEITAPKNANSRLYISHLTKSLLLLELQFGESLGVQLQYSIDPYSFMSVQIFS